MTPREPPSAARIAEIRRWYIDNDLSIDHGGELLAALDYCRETMLEARASITAARDIRAHELISFCLDSLFLEGPQ